MAPSSSSRASTAPTAWSLSPVTEERSAWVVLPSTRERTNASWGPMGSDLGSTPGTTCGVRSGTLGVGIATCRDALIQRSLLECKSTGDFLAIVEGRVTRSDIHLPEADGFSAV